MSGSGSTLIQTGSFADVKQTQFLSLPDVVSNVNGPSSQKSSTMYLNKEADQQMVINDYEVHGNKGYIGPDHIYLES